jgi:methylated-DNA-protein-cysteine methyltransferase-like protein
MPPKQKKNASWDSVFRFVKSIPRGRVISYGELARALRLPGGARTAGRAMSATPRGRAIPWHRVLGAGGRILVREPYASLQRRLLGSEGVQFIEGRVDWRRHAWKKSGTGARHRASRGAR